MNSAMGASCTASGTKTVAYDALGNITSKSDVGSYAYGAGAAGPHAVTSITGTVNGVTNPTYTYDANGNMTAGAGRSISLPFACAPGVRRSKRSTGAFGQRDALTAPHPSTWPPRSRRAPLPSPSAEPVLRRAERDRGNSAHQRISQVIGGGSPSTTTYLNALGAMSEKFVAGATTTWHDYIYAAGALVAEHFNTGGTETMRYAVADHQGSISSIADASAAVTERDGYDAWGKRRNADGTDNATCSITSAVGRGYTGHEMMDAVCLVNANARIYDPTLGRFMSADPTVPHAFDGQSYNRYAYVTNNPLAYTDPSGYAESAPLVQWIDKCAVSNACPPPPPIEEVVVTAYKQRQNPTPPIQLPNSPPLPSLGGGDGGGASAASAVGIAPELIETVIVIGAKHIVRIVPIVIDALPPAIILCGIFCSTPAGENCDDPTALGCSGHILRNESTEERAQRCEAAHATDVATCRAISRRRGAQKGEACYASASERLGACLAGRPIPPLNTWNN